MGLAEELQKLEALRRTGTLSDAEFAQAKSALLQASAEGPPSGLGGQVAEHLAAVAHQNRLAQLDREWELEREQYLVLDRSGRMVIPQPGWGEMFRVTGRGGAFVGVIAVVGGGVWTAFALWATRDEPFGPARLFPAIGILFAVFGLAAGINFSSTVKRLGREYDEKAARYQAAFERYQRRRQEAAQAGPNPAELTSAGHRSGGAC